MFARAHMFDAIDPSMILSDVKSKFISKLGEKGAQNTSLAEIETAVRAHTHY